VDFESRLWFNSKDPVPCNHFHFICSDDDAPVCVCMLIVLFTILCTTIGLYMVVLLIVMFMWLTTYFILLGARYKYCFLCCLFSWSLLVLISEQVKMVRVLTNILFLLLLLLFFSYSFLFFSFYLLLLFFIF
jgi:hypothetical protein